MDKEPIMIDGVDVSVCEAYSKHREGYCGWYTPCEGDSCSYKLDWALDQLKRKEQECEELKKRATIAEDNFACEIQARLYHQNEWLKFSKENEELKKSVDKIKNYVKNQMFDVDCENWFDRFIYTFEEWKKSICEDSARYLKALEEIEGIAKGMRSIFIEEVSITASQLNDRIYRETTERFRQILDIISKANPTKK